ncbi:Sec-independent protein translocase protein TatB [Aurantiacibacter aquimixticola]|uniref:Sec-independent protein translocase protein TatB n=1 Tax=Aurantiacibacter aquimixticola TaxID=1958945 RepID=A0A419RTD8_9SPHN|nr:Sec-independent protein translocase protein TatB [Aurantiacibacter aquimixticola]RJY09038.1 twin-arginine translocase subunit TatB [Aurantiacibacter aquimixticola]
MLDIGWTELLLIAIVAILVIGPKDMPLALRTAGRWIGKMRKLSAHFRTGVDAMVREAELEDMEKQWKAQNERIIREHPDGVPAGTEMEPTGAYPGRSTSSAEAPRPAPETADEAKPADDQAAAPPPPPSPPSTKDA